ncbi:family 43 glycosylhydrolase [Luteolibacter soli]|uniref:family 43 glycosylhydrolase n=1 Tax=Luteolibacter soli TaxID=3135280 RepID=UPI00311A576E
MSFALLALAAAPLPALAWQAAPGSMLTEWGEKLTPDTAWREYPRPELAREQWVNLNGLWSYAISPKEATAAPESAGEILVPFAIESSLSGVKKRITANDAIWYRREFELTPTAGKRVVLNFEAVDYQCSVRVNGTEVGSHTGGNLPFSFDITKALKPGKNTLELKVTDGTDSGYQLHGKQVNEPHGIWYTPVSGIWQTVWLEEVAENHITAVKITPSVSGKVEIALTTSGPVAEASVVASLNGKEVSSVSGPSNKISFTIPSPKLWSPDSPTLYDLAITLGEDKVKSYTGIRETTVAKDADGNLRFNLNGKPIFHWGTLDQGWWPDGLLTPPSEAAMQSDIDFLKAAGFNTIRKHIKVEPRRYYAYCDRIGMLVWQDQVSSGTGGGRKKEGSSSPPWTRLGPDPVDATWPDAAHEQYMAELKGMIDHLYSHPAIVTWVPFNEAWGQHRTMEVGKWIVPYDPTRQVNIASGGNWWPVGNIVDEHRYPDPGFPFKQAERFDGYVKVVGEFGGHGFPVEGHLWDPNARNWGYGGLPKDKDEWLERYKKSIRVLADLKSQGVAAGIYTQTTDVEGEINGLITYDRKVRKLTPEALAAIHRGAGLIDGGRKSAARREEGSTGENFPSPKPAPVQPAMSRAEIEAGLASHDKAIYIKEGWIRDPYITLGPDDLYYLTGTTPNPNDPREKSDPYNVGLGDNSIVGSVVQVWRSKDLVEWEYLGTPFTLKDGMRMRPGKFVWAPELHWMGDRWALVHCPAASANFSLTEGKDLKGPWTNPMKPGKLGEKHDPSLFKDGDTWWMLWQNTLIAPLSKDLASFTAEPVRIDPSGSRPGPKGEPISRIGHEGATMIKVGDKYVHIGTAWSTDKGRKGSYNLYYCSADKITGPYGPRKFAGRFLGHGTPFQTRDGKWWCTAFFNGNVPPLSREGIEKRDLGSDAQTINQRGVTLVPLEVGMKDGDVSIRAIDPAYGTPGPDEAQKF